jgi:hypothetical protein
LFETNNQWIESDKFCLNCVSTFVLEKVIKKMISAITQFEAKDFASAEILENIIKQLEEETPSETGFLTYKVFKVKDGFLKIGSRMSKNPREYRTAF